MSGLKNIDLNLLKVFLTLMEEQNVSRAAEALSVSQPAVSGMLNRLRQNLNDPLFVRSQRGIVPTVRAQALAGPVRRILDELDTALQPDDFDPQKVSMTLNVAVTDYSLNTVITPLLPRFRELAPELKIACHWLNESTLAEKMERGELDLALVIPETTPLDLKSRLLFEEHYVWVMRQAHPLAEAAPDVTTFCQAGHAIVSYNGGAFSGITDEKLRELGLSRNVVLSVPGFFVLLDMVRTSDLFAVVPARIARQVPDLKVLPLPVDVPGFAKYLVWHGRTHHSPVHGWIREAFRL